MPFNNNVDVLFLDTDSYSGRKNEDWYDTDESTVSAIYTSWQETRQWRYKD